MRTIRCLATVTFTVLPVAFAAAAPRNWVDRYISAHGHCSSPFTMLSTSPLDKPIEDWTDGDLADLKAALDRCDALPDIENGGGSNRWKGLIYQSVSESVRERNERAAREEDAKVSAREITEQAEARRQRRAEADKQATAARLAAFQRAAEAEADERKAAESRTVAVADELKAAHLADETEARAKAAKAEAQARYSVEAAKKRAAEAEEQARNAESQARSDREAADQRFANAHPDVNAPSMSREAIRPSSPDAIDEKTSCATATAAFDRSQAKSALAVDKYIDKIMREADRTYVSQAQGGIMAGLTSAGYLKVRMAAVEYCRQNPNMTLIESLQAMYDGVRGMQQSLGVRMSALARTRC